MVILARQQLFTETTITVVLPLLADFSRRNLVLWRACGALFSPPISLER